MAALIIEGTDCTSDSNNTDSTTVAVNLPAYADGDLIIINIDLWNATGTDRVISVVPAGPNAETLTTVVNASGGTVDNAARIAIFSFIGDGSDVGGDLVFTANLNTRWTAVIVLVLAGEFDAASPISSAVDDKDGAGGTPNFDAFTANSDDTDGKLLVFVGADQDPITGTPTLFTDLENLDGGRAAVSLGGRDAAVTSSESIPASAGWTIADDDWSTFAYIVRTFVATGGRTMSSLAYSGGLAHKGGIAGKGGGLAGQ